MGWFKKKSKLGKRYGRASAGKRDEGVSVDRDPNRIYFVNKRGKVMSTKRVNA
jgi:hypothetical protein